MNKVSAMRKNVEKQDVGYNFRVSEFWFSDHIALFLQNPGRGQNGDTFELWSETTGCMMSEKNPDFMEQGESKEYLYGMAKPASRLLATTP